MQIYIIPYYYIIKQSVEFRHLQDGSPFHGATNFEFKIVLSCQESLALWQIHPIFLLEGKIFKVKFKSNLKRMNSFSEQEVCQVAFI